MISGEHLKSFARQRKAQILWFLRVWAVLCIQITLLSFSVIP